MIIYLYNSYYLSTNIANILLFDSIINVTVGLESLTPPIHALNTDDEPDITVNVTVVPAIN
jgi:hypothetical protein